jgi:TolB-like protein
MPSFFSELRRRNVLRVAAAYALVAWIIIEAGSVLLPTFGATEGTFQVYVIIVMVGFFVAVVLAWIFEITPEGVKLDRDLDQRERVDKRSKSTMNYLIIGLLAVALGVSITFNVTGIRNGDAPPPVVVQEKPAIAVLPFTSLSSEPDNAVFADGIHGDILTQLASIGSCKVISRSSVMEYRNTTKNVREIGEELAVGSVLQGSVQRVGDTVRINVQLVDATNDVNVWAETYDRQLTAHNIFDIQTEISQAIATALETTLTPAEQVRIAAKPTADLRAYSAYISGRDNLYLRRLETLRRARENFEQAIAYDPNYAAAYAGLAESVLLLENGSVRDCAQQSAEGTRARSRARGCVCRERAARKHRLATDANRERQPRGRSGVSPGHRAQSQSRERSHVVRDAARVRRA